MHYNVMYMHTHCNRLMMSSLISLGMQIQGSRSSWGYWSRGRGSTRRQNRNCTRQCSRINSYNDYLINVHVYNKVIMHTIVIIIMILLNVVIQGQMYSNY